jgi:peptidoglycan hydrolase-like protein with peptidoglycan-binding domain
MPVHARTLKRGDVGEDVAELQRMLTAAGFPVPDIGTYGPVTERMVREYQSSHGLDADGIAGPRTLASLRGEAPPTLPQGVPPSVLAGDRGLLLTCLSSWNVRQELQASHQSC